MDSLRPAATANREVSYLRARDPSINNWQAKSIRKIRKNIFEEFITESTIQNRTSGTYKDESTMILEESVDEETEDDPGIHVYLRVRDIGESCEDFTIKGNELIYKTRELAPSSSRAMKNLGFAIKTYTFTDIFKPDTQQIEIFDSVVKPRVLEFINGKNTSLFTYGASGAGKTFTMIGTANEPGLIPRALEYLFRTLPDLPSVSSVKETCNGEVMRLNHEQQMSEAKVRNQILDAQKGTTRTQHVETYKAMRVRLSTYPVGILEDIQDISIGVWVTFTEIYNEEIFDLLGTQPKKNKLQVVLSNGKSYIKNLTHINVSNSLEAYQVFQYGIQKLKYAETGIHNHSSRSHSIFSIKLVQDLNNGGGSYVSTFSFCDLAGIERSKKTMNIGERLKESNSINTSLLVLGRCIAALRNSQKNPSANKMLPFRESKLTQLFQRALSGLEDFFFIININISKKMLEETLNVLNFSAIAKEITDPVQPEIKANTTIDNYDEMNGKLENELAELKEQYEKLIKKKDEMYEMEQQSCVKIWTEIQEDKKQYWQKKTERMIENHKSRCSTKLKAVEKYCDQKLKRAESRKLKAEDNYYKNGCSKNEEILVENKRIIGEFNETIKELEVDISNMQQEIQNLIGSVGIELSVLMNS